MKRDSYEAFKRNLKIRRERQLEDARVDGFNAGVQRGWDRGFIDGQNYVRGGECYGAGSLCIRPHYRDNAGQ